ncbi:hypothetical protein D1872_239260 [compost metagenome]
MNEEIDDNSGKDKDASPDNKRKRDNFRCPIMNNRTVKINDHQTDNLLIGIMIFKNGSISAEQLSSIKRVDRGINGVAHFFNHIHINLFQIEGISGCISPFLQVGISSKNYTVK